MNWGEWAAWGFLATIVLIVIAEASQGLGMTRMSMPYLLGTLVTPNRRRAKFYGVLLHFLNGAFVSLVYVLIFHAIGFATWWLGALFGLIHAAFMLVAGMAALPGIHPRMASESHGPEVTKQLEPPGFLGMNYGVRTPLTVIVSHVAFGIVLGVLYHVG